MDNKKPHFKGSVYAAEDAATGLYLNLDGSEPRLAPFTEATRFPGTAAGRLAACARLAAMAPASPYELVRRDA